MKQKEPAGPISQRVGDSLHMVENKMGQGRLGKSVLNKKGKTDLLYQSVSKIGKKDEKNKYKMLKINDLTQIVLAKGT